MNKDNENVTTDASDQDEPTSYTKQTETQKPESKAPDKSSSEISMDAYQGLQRVLAKRDKELATLQEQHEKAMEELAELKAGKSNAERTQEEISTRLTELESKLQNAASEKEQLEKTVTQQGLLLSEFPDLAPMAEFIPGADDADGYRENAKRFQEALSGFVKARVDDTLEGASPPPPDGNKDRPTQSKIDAAYQKAANLAGNPDKADEYEKAFEEYMALVGDN